MENMYQCPKCKATLKFNNSPASPNNPNSLVKCPKCAYQGPAAGFKKAPVRVVWCPGCNTSLNIIVKEGRYNIRCPKCQHTADIAAYLDKPKAQAPDDNDPGTGLPDDLKRLKQLFKPCVLILEKGNCDPERIVLKKGKNTIGRESSSILLSGDQRISRKHAAIEVIVKKDYTIEHRLSDRNSKNGTYHNGILLEPGDVSILMPGDTVGFGSQTLYKFIME
jgi:DNA-directed RNA polymerase subunit M/transcription elongation factor TFIIS